MTSLSDRLSTSARALWYGAVRKFNGKTPEEFVAAADKNPPATKKDGQAEPAAGWLRYFVKEGMVQLVAQPDAPAPATDAASAPATKKKGAKK